MDEFFKALGLTPLPTIFVVAGIFFWILAIAGSLAGKITIQRRNQKTARLVGTVLIALGLVLSFFAPSTQDEAEGKGKTSETTGSINSKSWRLGTGGPFIRPVPPGRSVWAVGKSTVYLEPTGDERQFFLVEPSEDLSNQGVQSGVLFFDGRKVNATYEGKVFLFPGQRCGTREYDASGPVTKMIKL